MRRRFGALLAIGLMACSVSPVLATVFDTPATLGDRRVTLTWAADPDDPFHTGNLMVLPEGRDTLGTAEYTQLLFSQFGNVLWLVSRAGDAVVSLLSVESTWMPGPTLPALDGGDVTITCAGLHPTGHLLVAGLADGRLAVWRTGAGTTPELLDAHDGPCNGIAFRPLAVQADSSFVTVGADGRMKQWSRPGVVRSDSLLDPAGLYAAAFDREGERVAIGCADGRVEVWEVAADVAFLRRLSGAADRTVIAVSWSQDGKRLAGADDQGGIRLWDVPASSSLGSYEPATPSPTDIAFTPEKSDFIAYARADGKIGVVDGRTCRVYNVQQQLGRPITGFALTPDGLTGFFGGDAGRIDWWHQGQCVPSAAIPECFGGYILWRGPSERPEELVRLRTYEFGDTTWMWSSSDSSRAFVDPDSIAPRGGDPELTVPGPHNGFPYYYSITKYYRQFLSGDEFDVYSNTQTEGLYREVPGGDPTPLVPRVDAVTEAPLLGSVFVAPDPYREDDPEDRFGQYAGPEIRFFKLPALATIRIYTMNGELVRTLEHVQQSGGVSGGQIAWDLKNEHQRDVTSGVYLYAVQTPSGESRTGFLTIVR
jgi:hypothetical protein